MLGAIICALLLAGGLLLFVQQGFRVAFRDSPLQSLASSLAIVSVPTAGLWVCLRALNNDKPIWPLIAAIVGGLIGGAVMLVFVGVGWHYHPNASKLPGLAMVTVCVLLGSFPYLWIAKIRLKGSS